MSQDCICIKKIGLPNLQHFKSSQIPRKNHRLGKPAYCVYLLTGQSNSAEGRWPTWANMHTQQDLLSRAKNRVSWWHILKECAQGLFTPIYLYIAVASCSTLVSCIYMLQINTNSTKLTLSYTITWVFTKSCNKKFNAMPYKIQNILIRHYFTFTTK